MQYLHQANIISFHQERMESIEGDYYALGWRSPESQSRRFDALISGINLNHASLLDVGCGYADFKTFLDKKFNKVSYTGIELVPAFAHEAARRFASDKFCSFLSGDFFTTPLSMVDYVFSCGALSYRNTDENYHFKMIQKMWETSRKGISFCMLNKDVFPNHPLLVGYNKKEVLGFCEKLRGNVIINDNYLPDDFTIKITKGSLP